MTFNSEHASVIIQNILITIIEFSIAIFNFQGNIIVIFRHFTNKFNIYII